MRIRGCSSSQLPAAGGTGGRSEGRWWWYCELGPCRRQRHDANSLDRNDHWPCQGEPPPSTIHQAAFLLSRPIVGEGSSRETSADSIEMLTHVEFLLCSVCTHCIYFTQNQMHGNPMQHMQLSFRAKINLFREGALQPQTAGTVSVNLPQINIVNDTFCYAVALSK